MRESLSSEDRSRVLRSVKRHVLNHHINLAHISYDTWGDHLDERAPHLLSAEPEDFEAGVRDLLSELGTSHILFYRGVANELPLPHSINGTVSALCIGGKQQWVFVDVHEDGPADLAGIKPGDVLHAIDGKPSVPPAVPALRIGQRYTLTVSDIESHHVRDLAIQVPRSRNTKQRPAIIEPKSLAHAVMEGGIGVLRVRYFPGAFGLGFGRELDVRISDLKAKGCQKLIIDLRGNLGGGLGFARLASYLCPGQMPIGLSVTPSRSRTGYDREKLPHVRMPCSRSELALTLARFVFRDKSLVLLTQGLGAQPFHNRIVMIVNEWTNSAAEMLAGFAQENRLARVVGTKTGGHVVGAANFKVGCGYWLRIPVFGWSTPKGRSLEGTGIYPDIVVEVDPRLLNRGVDQLMDKAVEIVRKLPGQNSGAQTPQG